MSRLVDCWCDKTPPSGCEEPCTRKATQEDMLCDECRSGCQYVAIGPAGADPKNLHMLATHAKVEVH